MGPTLGVETGRGTTLIAADRVGARGSSGRHPTTKEAEEEKEGKRAFYALWRAAGRRRSGNNARDLGANNEDPSPNLR